RKLDLTGVGIAFEPGHVRVSCTIAGEGPLLTISGAISVLVGFTLETPATGTELVLRAVLEQISPQIDTNDAADVCSFGATQALADAVAAVIRSIATRMFDEHVAGQP